jgi:hypothetical protein
MSSSSLALMSPVDYLLAHATAVGCMCLACLFFLHSLALKIMQAVGPGAGRVNLIIHCVWAAWQPTSTLVMLSAAVEEILTLLHVHPLL